MTPVRLARILASSSIADLGTEPPTRPQTLHDASVPPPQTRPSHPYAYPQAQSALPFSSLKQQPGLEESAHINEPIRQQPTRESEVLSRGAGMRALAGQAFGDFDDSTHEKSGSAGMGTFGKDPKSAHNTQADLTVSQIGSTAQSKLTSDRRKGV